MWYVPVCFSRQHMFLHLWVLTSRPILMVNQFILWKPLLAYSLSAHGNNKFWEFLFILTHPIAIWLTDNLWYKAFYTADKMTLGVGLLIELNKVLILHSNCPVSHLLGSSYIYWWQSSETYKLKPGPKFSHLNSNLSICIPCYDLTSLYQDLLKVTRALKIIWYFKRICLPFRITAKIFSKSFIITLKIWKKS